MPGKKIGISVAHYNSSYYNDCMKIVFFEVLPEEKEKIEASLQGHELEFYEEKLSHETVHLAKGSDCISIFINTQIDKSILDELDGLKLITTRTTGSDHIDLVAAKEKGILISNVPSYGSAPVAEFTFALILSLSRNIFNAYHQIREGGDFDIHSLRGFDIHGKTLGVVGTGKIGASVIKIANGFGMKVIAYDKYPNKDLAEKLGFIYEDFAKVLSESDIITLHVPYLKETHHLINENNIKSTKSVALLINTSRGELIETGALLSALKNGGLRGAGLDVLEGERELHSEFAFISRPDSTTASLKTIIQDHVLIDLPNVIITPHIAFFSKEAKEEILKVTAQNILALAENKPQNLL